MRLAKQEREKGRQSERERGEEGQVLRKVQGRVQELKAVLGGRVKQLEQELAKSEAARGVLREKMEGEVRQVMTLLILQQNHPAPFIIDPLNQNQSQTNYLLFIDLLDYFINNIFDHL